MIDKAILRRTGDYLLAQPRLRLLLHKHPDGDAIGSCLGLARFLAARGKDVGVFGPFDISPKFDFLPGFADILDGREEAGDPDFADTLYAVVDSTGVDRTGFAAGDFQRLLRLDHHIDGARYGDHDLHDTAAAAAALIVCDLLRAVDEDAIDTGVATCLYTGLMTDTGGFRYTNTDAHVFRSAGFLVERGAEPARIATLVHERRPAVYLDLLRRALDSLTLHAGGRVALLTLRADGLPADALALFGSDDFINLPRSLEGVEVVVQMKLVPEGDWKIGFRGKGRVNVQTIAAHFGGGGHFSASGCELEGDEAELRARILDRVLAALAEADASA
ncbi:MAG: bifunctional oligoribonuclease/PAP phosphatase NrnA [Candidatus Krumholzibacteriota bacterium]|nr:bifunctional oligoribonuclease/PAP phosphatase NrnA [Candidatus Krumholzibacteriota bacterium]